MILEKDSLQQKGRIAFFLSHPIQYITPLLKAINEQFDLEVFYYSDASIRGQIDKGFGKKIKWDIPLLEGYKYSFLKNYASQKSLGNHLFDVFNPGIIKAVRTCHAKIIILNGWAYISDILAIITAKFSGKKVWLRAENPYSQEIGKSKTKIGIKKILLKHILFRFFIDQFLYIGSENKKFFEYYGVKNEKFVYTPYSVDNSFFNMQYLQLLDKQEETRSELNIPKGKKIVLFSGKYIEKKRPLDLLNAILALDDNDICLIMMGEGNLRPQMELFIKTNKMTNVLLTGFINQSLVSKYYSIADIFVMCSGSGETWGLSVNEAMNFSLPLVVSSTTGCSSDLVKHGQNGFVFEEGNIEELAKYLKLFLSGEVLRKKAGMYSKEIINSYSIPIIVNNLSEAFRRD